MRKSFFHCAAVLFALGACAFSAQGQGTNNDVQKVIQDNNAFAFDLYAQLAKEKGNVFFSPYSISTALGMTYGGAKGATAQAMAKTMHFSPEQNRFHPAMGAIIRQQNEAGKKGKYLLSVANALWGQKGMVIQPDFLQLNQQNYGAGLKDVNFIEDTENARKTINQWVEKETQNKIKDLIQPGVLTPDTRLVLTNAIYFKSAWLHVFQEAATKKENFTLNTGEKVQTPMMNLRDKFSLYQGDQFQLLDMPYERGDLSLITLLPKKAGDLSVVEGMIQTDKLNQWLQNVKRYEVNVKYPKFKTTFSVKLRKALTELGMGLAFSNDADFSGISTQNKLAIGEVIHKAFINLDEKGTEAAAATAVEIRTTSIQPNIMEANFFADHPFLYLIRDNRSGSILFMGRLENPQK